MKNLLVRLFIIMLLLSVGHSHRILKVKYTLLSIQLLGLCLDAMSALMRGPIQSSVERYHDVIVVQGEP